MRSFIFFLCLFSFICSNSLLGEELVPLSLKELLSNFKSQNLKMESQAFLISAEESSLEKITLLPPPKILVESEVKEGVRMNYLGISQMLLLPTRYNKQREIQKSQTELAKSEERILERELTKEIKILYYKWVFFLKMKKSLLLQKEKLKEMSRLTEINYTIGEISKSEEMMIHLEQTKVENKIIKIDQLILENKISLQNILATKSRSDTLKERLPKVDPLPKMKKKEIELLSEDFLRERLQNHLPELTKKNQLIHLSKSKIDLLKADYLPEGELSFKKLVSSKGDYSIGLEIAIPFWFWKSPGAEIRAERMIQSSNEKEEGIEFINRLNESKILLSKVKSEIKITEIYQTSILPQLKNIMASQLSLYRSGKGKLLELLKSEQLLYENEVSYYEETTDLYSSIINLESLLQLGLLEEE